MSRFTRVLLTCLVVCPISIAGTYYTTLMSGASGATTLLTSVDGQNARLEATSSDSSIPVGMTILTHDGGQNLFMLLPAEKKYLAMSRLQYDSMRKRQANQAGFKPLGVPKIEKQLEEDGGLVAGLPTRHFKLHIAIQLDRGVPGSVPSDLIVDEELWTATGIPKQPAGLNLLFQQGTGIAELDHGLEFEEIPGFRVKRLVKITVDGEDIGQTTVEVKDYREQTFDPSTFSVPTDYKKVDVKKLKH